MLALPNNQATCRLLRPEDASALASLFDSFCAAGLNKFFHPHPLTTEEAAARARHKGEDVFAVATCRDRFVGYAMLRGWDEGYDIPSFGVAVESTVQGFGFGVKLLEFLYQVAKQRGAKKILVKIHPDNQRVVKLYRQLGHEFEPALEKGYLIAYLDVEPHLSSPWVRRHLGSELSYSI
jgi:ribosomal-protein-alanine N-acetyltransferase